MPTLRTSSLSTTATENNVLSMPNDTFAEQEKSPMSKANAQSRKDVKPRWNLKARHKPTIDLKPSQNRRTRQPFVTFESGGDAEEIDSTLARYLCYCVSTPCVNLLDALENVVMTAPWVNNPSSTLDSPSSINYPTMCSMTVNPTINANRFCVRSPGGCWSPLSPTVCVSSGINYPFEVTNPHHVAHSPLKLSDGSPAYNMEMKSRSYGQKQVRGCTVQASDTNLEMGPALLFENYAAREDQRDFRALTVDNRVKHLHANNVTGALEQRQNKLLTQHSGLLVPNTWAKLTPAPSTPPMRSIQCQLRRVAVSLETLNTNQENSGEDSYSLVLLQQSCSPCLSTSVCAGHDEYQSLLMRDCQPHIVELQQTARNKQTSGSRRPECPLSDSVCFSHSSPNNNRRTRNSQSVGACVQMPTLRTSSLSTTATENNVLSMPNDTFAEQEKSPMSKANAQSRKDVKPRWNLKARHKPTIDLKPSQNRRTRQPFVTFESGGDAEEIDSTLARFVKSEITCGNWEPTITHSGKLARSRDAKSVSQPTTPVKTATVQRSAARGPTREDPYDSLVLLQQSCSPCLSTSVCAGHDEYQSLLMRDCQPHIVELQQTARNKQTSGSRRPECPLSDSVCFSHSSPNNNRRTRNSQSVGACVQMPTLRTSSLSTTATENNVLSMPNDTFAEQEKSPMSKANAQSRKDVKPRWNLKARHKPTIDLKPSQNRRTRQPFVTFESGGDAEEIDSTLARFVKSEITCGNWEPTITHSGKLARSRDAKSVSQPTTPVKTATVQVQGSFV
ncbi:hypothetical protein AHF37_08560 [Paragonimus kellicotti]|nr:hypothetical protein AHF37_08560 [Paragonimus kellicotti]